MFALGSATLMLEVLLTRIAAVTLFANLAFGVIALSLFGLAVGSAWAERRSFKSEEERERAIAIALLCAAILTLISALLATTLPLVPEALEYHGKLATTFSQRRNAVDLDPGQVRWSLVALLVATQAAPFAMAGYAQALAFVQGNQPASVLYAADLAGAMVGSVATLALLRGLGAADGVGVVALLFVVASMLGAESRGRLRAAAGVAAALSVVVLVARPFDIRHAAGFAENRIVAVDWSALARIGLYERSGSQEGVEDATLVVDNTSATDVALTRDSKFDSNLERIPYLLRPRGDVLVIGAGGGQEIETALATAPGRERHIDAVELAGGEERLLRRFYGNRPDFLLDQPGVHYQIADGRSFLEMATRRWDVIEMKEVNFHTFAGQASSAWTPSLLFTAEAMRSELAHLAPHGLLAMNRGMYYGGDLSSTLETLATMRSATESLGWELAPRLVIVDRPRESGFQRMCIVSESPLEDPDLAMVSDLAAHAGLTLRRTPRLPYTPIEDIVAAPFDEALTRIRFRHRINVGPLTDDRPFGYQYLSFFEALFGFPDAKGANTHQKLQRADYRFLSGGCLFLIAATSVLVARSAARVPKARRTGALRQLAICGLLGIGFMLLEVILVERTSLLLGHPTVAFVAVVTSMLCGLGIGSILSGRWLPEASLKSSVALAITTLVAAAALVVLPAWVAPWFRGIDAGVRPWVAGVAMLLGAIPLGGLLPSVLRVAATRQAASAAACWSTNAACSVIGTLGAALLVRSAGFTETSRAAWALYASALVLWLVECRLSRQPSAATPEPS
jgi:spermidine synthase